MHEQITPTESRGRLLVQQTDEFFFIRNLTPKQHKQLHEANISVDTKRPVDLGLVYNIACAGIPVLVTNGSQKKRHLVLVPYETAQTRELHRRCRTTHYKVAHSNGLYVLNQVLVNEGRIIPSYAFRSLLNKINLHIL